MNMQERKMFWDVLCSVDGRNPNADSLKLSEVIKYPKYLYRYRSVNPKSMEALKTNRLYFSCANYFDDPFDTFLHIDIESIYKEFLSAFQTEDSTAAVIEGIKEWFGEDFEEERNLSLTVRNLQNAATNELGESFKHAALNIRYEVRKHTWAICFSENCLNEVLWLKYANNHKGFVLIYDLEEKKKWLSGCCSSGDMPSLERGHTSLYPMYYSDVPYNATKFAKRVLIHLLEEQIGKNFPMHLDDSIISGIWEQERTTLIKKECHHYDEEWRMITTPMDNEVPVVEWMPSGIILGLCMSKKDEDITISFAREAGIKNIYKAYIDNENRLNAYLANIVN